MFSFNGIGTTLYGKRESEPDGSYIATKWFTVIFLPIIPLGSFRVKKQGHTAGIPHVISSTQYERMDKIPLDLRQVRNTYLLWALIVFLWWLFFGF